MLPLNYSLSLIALVLLTLVSIYLEENLVSLLFVSLFALYFYGTPWIVEPLRIPDTLIHFSRVVVVNNLGHTPSTYEHYFDFPGSTFFGSFFILISSSNSLFFLKIFFPFLSMFVFYLGFSVFIFGIFKDMRVVSLGLLLASIFGWGAVHFSPVGVAQMIFPFMLFTCGRQKYSVCFFLLMFSLVICDPTLCVFLIFGLFAYVLISRLMNRRVSRLLLYQVALFALTFFAWSLLNSPTVMLQIGILVKELVSFSLGKGTTQGLTPPISPLVQISYTRRIFVIFSTLLSAVVLFLAGLLFFEEPQNPAKHT